MGIVKKLNLRSPKNARVDFGRFYGVDLRLDGEVGGYNRAEMSYNCSVLDGSLKTSLGLKSLNDKYIPPVDDLISSVYYFRHSDYQTGVRDDRIIAYTDTGNMYEVSIDGGEFTIIKGLTFNNQPIGVCYNYNSSDVIIFSAEGEGIKIYDGEKVTVVSDAPSVTSMCVHSERLFITSGGVDGALWFSDDFDPTNWNVSLNEAGFIDMSDDRGEMICAVAFGGYVYVFRSYGVSRVSAYGDQSEFSVSHLLVSCGKIIKNTITVCGDCIMFFASDGLYRFDGYNAVKISEPWFNLVDTSPEWVKGVYYNGYTHYLLYFTIDGVKVRGVFRINPSGTDYQFIYVAALIDIAVISGENCYKLFAVERMTRRLGELCKGGGWGGDPLPMAWKSKQTDFGIKAREKILKKVSFYATAPVTLTVWVDGEEHSYQIDEYKKRCQIRPNLKGSKFAFKIFLREVEAEVSGLTLDFAYYQ
ncbi:MAG: hypothetical protein IJW64_02105 [Clostridia bacterium]|nr:hypothetical protein [Clostridia bacterium]